MVVKPAHLVGDARVQPGLKVRGREYLRIIYGPDYTDSLDLLRERHLGKKRSLALREHGLGLDALDRLRRPARRCGGCTSWSSRSWRSSRSRSTRGSEAVRRCHVTRPHTPRSVKSCGKLVFDELIQLACSGVGEIPSRR